MDKHLKDALKDMEERKNYWYKHALVLGRVQGRLLATSDNPSSPEVQKYAREILSFLEKQLIKEGLNDEI
jgi:hypothetical protein